jgi:hypothetical protein
MVNRTQVVERMISVVAQFGPHCFLCNWARGEALLVSDLSPGQKLLFAEWMLSFKVWKWITATSKRSCKSLPDIDIWEKLG